MTIVSFLSRRRRVLALCAGSVLLHSLAVGWFGAHLRLSPQRTPEPQPATIVAQLHAAAPVPQAVAALPHPSRAAPARARPKPAATPVASAEARAQPAPETEPGTAPDLPATAQDEPTAEAVSGDAGQRGAAEAAADVQSAQPPGADPAAEPPPASAEPAAGPQPRRYKASVPPSAELKLDVARTDADGTVWNGEAAMVWKLSGGGYKLTVEAGIGVIVTRVNLVALTSEGSIAETGFAPLTLTEKRRGRAMTATHFNYPEGRITFSASQNAYPLLPGSQDKATLPLQLAAIARADVSQLGSDIEIMVGEDKDASLFRFVVLGQEEITTGLGKMQTWHLSRPPRPGAYGSRLDVWLAPAHEWYPVRIRNTEANGAVTTQTVSKILVTDSER
jgi:hypothetical protein